MDTASSLVNVGDLSHTKSEGKVVLDRKVKFSAVSISSVVLDGMGRGRRMEMQIQEEFLHEIPGCKESRFLCSFNGQWLVSDRWVAQI